MGHLFTKPLVEVDKNKVWSSCCDDNHIEKKYIILCDICSKNIEIDKVVNATNN